MKKNIFALIALLSLSSFGFAQNDSTDVYKAKHFNRISLGLRGGLSINVGNSNIKATPGGNILFDLQYATLWRKNSTHLGFLVGASVGYVQTGGTKPTAIDRYTTATTDGDITYTISADQVAEKRQELVVEIPLMFSLVDNCGVFFNFGPRLVIPVKSLSLVTFANPDIKAYFPTEGVTVPNELITGKINDWKEPQKAIWTPNPRLLLATELGYEFRFHCGHSLGLGVYTDFNLTPLQQRDNSLSFIRVTAPSNKVQPASLEVASPIAHFAPNLGIFDLGLKLSYHFNVK